MVLVATFWKQWVMSILFCLSFWSMCCGDSDTHTHLKDRPSCIQDIPKTCSSSWSQGEKIGLCKNCVKSCRKTCKSPQNSLGPSFSILCHHFKPHQQRPPVQCNQRRLKNVLSFTHLSAVFSSSVYASTESTSASSVALHSPGTEDTPTNGGTEVRVERSNRTLSAYCIIGYYKCWKVHCQILLVIVIYVCGFIVWSGIWWILANTIIII